MVCMGNSLVPKLCTQNLHRLHVQFVGTYFVNIGATQVAWAICWYPHCAHRAYIGCMGNLLAPTMCTQGLHRLHGQFVGTHNVHIGSTQVAWAICRYPHCAHRAYIGCMGNLLPPTMCTQGLHRLHGQFLGTHIVHIEPTQVAWAICWYPLCEHRGYIGCMGNLLVLTLCTQGLHRLLRQFVGTHIVHIGPTQVDWAICWYPQCAHRAYIGGMGNLLVPTLCTQSLHRLFGQFVGTHIVHIGPTYVAWAICWYSHCAHPTQVAWAICWYTHCAHRAYIGCMGNLLVPTLCTQSLYRLHGQFVGTHIVHIEPTQVAGTICWYSHCAHRAYIGCMGNLLGGLHRLHGQFVGTHIVHIGPTQVVWAICWYPHCAHRAYICCMGNLLVLTLCTQSLHRLHGHNLLVPHIVHIGPTQVAWAICWYSHCAHRAYIGCMGNLLVPTLCTQGLHRLHGKFVGTHIVHIGPTQVAWAICRLHIVPTQVGQFVGTHIVHIGPTQVAWAICWYSHCAHRAYIGCMGNLLVLTLCTQNLHRLHGQFVGTHFVNIGATQVAWAICWYSHCAHRAYIGCMGNLLVLTLCTQGLHRLHGQFVGTHIVHIGPTQVAWAICWHPQCAHRVYIGCMGNLLVPTLCTQGLHRLHGQFVGTHNVHIGSTQVAWAICWYPHCAHRAYIGCMGNLSVPTLCTQGLHRLHGQFVGTHNVHIGSTQVAWAICWYPHCAHRTYIGCMGNLLVPTLCTQGLHRLHGQFVGTHIVNDRGYIGCMGNLLVPTLCTQSLHRLHGQFVGTHIVHIGPTQVCMGNSLVPKLCTQNLHRLHGQFVGTHFVNIGATQVAWAICWYSHCAHRAYIGCFGNLLVLTLCTQGLHRLLGQFVGTHIVHIGPTQVACAICWHPQCAHRVYIGCMGNLLVPTLCTQGLHRLHGQFVGTHNVHIGSTQVAWAICWHPQCADRVYIGCMGNLSVPTLCTQGLHRLHGQFVGTHNVHIGSTQVAWAISWYPHCAHRTYIGCMGNLLVPTL